MAYPDYFKRYVHRVRECNTILYIHTMAEIHCLLSNLLKTETTVRILPRRSTPNQRQTRRFVVYDHE